MYIKNSIFALSLLLVSASAVNASELSSLFKQVDPAVVILRIFERTPSINKQTKEKMTSIEGMGSGVVISADGKVLTAAHVVHLADSIHVEFEDGTKSIARVVASEPNADIALLQLETVPKNLKFVKLANSDQVSPGDKVFVIGAPYGIGHSLTAGYISGRRSPDTQTAFSDSEFFQTDAAINQGNSGGPMFNYKGEIIGIVSHILSRSGGFEGMGFAVTSNTAKNLLLNKKSFWSGVDGTIINGDLAKIFHLPQDTGILVERVAMNSMGQKAGILAGDTLAVIDNKKMILGGDVLLSLDGIPLGTQTSYSKVREKMRSRKPGEILKLRLLRGSQIKVVKITVPEKY